MTKLDALNEILTNKLDSEKGASVLDAINNASKSYKGADNATSIAEALKNLSDVFEKGGEGGKLPDYEGATDVTPSLEEQTLTTAGKSVNSDITVKAIEPVYDSGVNVVDAVTDEATTATKTTSKAITNKSSKVYVRPTIKSEGWYKAQDGDTQTEIQIDEAEQAKIVAENIKKGVSILGVEGTLDEQGGKLPDYEGATDVTPSLEEQTLTTAGKSVNSDITVKAIEPVYDSGVNVVDAVTDEATTATKTTSKAITNKSSKVYVRPTIKSEGWYKAQDGDTQTEIQIDEAEQAKIVAENIKKGVSILGVEGTLDEQGGGTAFSTITVYVGNAGESLSQRVGAYLGVIDMSTLNIATNSHDFRGFFLGCLATKIVVPTYANATNMFALFSSCRLLKTIENFENFNTSSVTDMGQMFYTCEALTNLDLSSFNTSSVTNMEQMFNWCKALTNLDLSSFNTSSVTNMQYMFANCKALTNLDLSSFNTSSVTDMGHMFYTCEALTNLDLSSFNTSSVTNMDAMFSFASNLENVIWGKNWGAGLEASTSPVLSFYFTPKFTHSSALDLINKLADHSSTGGGRIVEFNTALQPSITDEEIAIATAKGWEIQFA